MTVSFSAKVASLQQRIRECESTVVGFSGGVDSALLVAVAFQQLGAANMIAVTGVSASVPSQDRTHAAAFCRARGIPFREVETEEFADERYLANPHNRCYFCKQELYRCLSCVAEELHFKAVIDGTNASDLGGHRPGWQAVQENMKVVAPLVDAHFSKEEVRRLARDLGLEVHDKVATACLASRVATALPIDAELLGRIDRAEDQLRALGFRQVRVRHHGDVARIEVGRDEILAALTQRYDIERRVIDLGWQYVTLDLRGYG